jgi:D-alanine-D-alanine ligase
VALLAGPDGVEVLPPAEIDFSAFPPEKPRIVGHRAKWDENSFEYNHTPRTFDFHEADRPLLDEISGLSQKCWELFSLRGWARVDFRVDTEGRPWILEINTNPCLSPDAGFFAALARAGIPFDEAIQRIVEEVG